MSLRLARLVPVAALALGLLFVTGCGPAKLNVTKNWDLETGDAVAIEIDAQKKPQKLTVDFTSSEEVFVGLFKEADAKGEDGLLGADPAKALGKEKSKSGSFSADVPESTATRLIVRGATKKAKVEVKVTNK